jgi:hypothetical protein
MNRRSSAAASARAVSPRGFTLPPPTPPSSPAAFRAKAIQARRKRDGVHLRAEPAQKAPDVVRLEQLPQKRAGRHSFPIHAVILPTEYKGVATSAVFYQKALKMKRSY